jgi:hypothetical protein
MAHERMDMTRRADAVLQAKSGGLASAPTSIMAGAQRGNACSNLHARVPGSQRGITYSQAPNGDAVCWRFQQCKCVHVDKRLRKHRGKGSVVKSESNATSISPARSGPLTPCLLVTEELASRKKSLSLTQYSHDPKMYLFCIECALARPNSRRVA